MKHPIAVLTLALGMALGFTFHASAQQHVVNVTVPFDFAVDGQVLPQGNYRIGTDGDFLLFKDSGEATHLFLRGFKGDASKDGRSALVFDNVKGNYFLRKIVTTSDNLNMDFRQSDLEQKTATSEGSRSIYAQNSSR